MFNKKKCLSVFISVFCMNAYGVASSNEQAKTVLDLTRSQSMLMTALAEHYGALDNSDAADENDSTRIYEQVASADIVYADLAGSADNDEVNAYLAEARKLNKLIVVENMDAQTVPELPLSFDAQVVIVKPATSGNDEISTYSTEQKGIETNVGTVNADDQVDVVIPDMATPSAVSMSLNTLVNDDNNAILTDVTNKLDDYLMPAFTLYSSSSSASGGQLGYECPTASKDEHLCYSAIVTNSVYSYDDDELVFNVVHGYSYAAYRTDSGTSIFVSPYGSVNPTMKYNKSTKRGYYLKYVKPEIAVTQSSVAGMTLFKRTPENQNGSSSISTTSGMSYSIEAEISDKASLGGSIEYSESQSQSTNLSDWKAVTTTSGYDANWSYELSKYTSLNDWVSQSVFETAKFASVPDISRYGLQYSAEGLWYGNLTDVSGTFSFTVTTQIALEKIKFTDNSIFGWSADWTEKSVTLKSGASDFNTDWLKAL